MIWVCLILDDTRMPPKIGNFQKGNYDIDQLKSVLNFSGYIFSVDPLVKSLTTKLFHDATIHQVVNMLPCRRSSSFPGSLAQRQQSRQPQAPARGDGRDSQWHPEILWKTGWFRASVNIRNNHMCICKYILYQDIS